MNEKQESNFLDPKTLLAIAMVAAVFFGWQWYLKQKYPDYFQKKEVAQEVKSTDPAKPVVQSGETARSGDSSIDQPELKPGNKQQPETFLSYQNGLFSFDLSSKGMGLHRFTLREFKDREGHHFQFGLPEKPLYELSSKDVSGSIDFVLSQKSEHEFEGVARLGDSTIKRVMKIHPDTGKIENEIFVSNESGLLKGIVLSLWDLRNENSGGSFLMPSLDHQEFLYRKNGTTERTMIVGSDSIKAEATGVSMAAMSSQYFTAAFADKSSVLPSVVMNAPQGGPIFVEIAYSPVQSKGNWEVRDVLYIGGKSFSRLQGIDPEFVDVVDLGMFAYIGRILLRIMQWSHGVVGNWGWAIVILTLLVRALVLPFNIASYRSMKKMQAIQPMLQSLRERYKEDPATMNRESMALMREQKVNPLGGCLPMLLQMPIFFALYQVLGQSIELYQAPFIFWIHDLSLKDPFYILPILMGVVMFFQQKLTPTTMDPMQAKILQWMPVIFSVFMLGLPSGLTLYIFVSTAFSVGQQMLFMRDTSKTPAIVDVKAQRVL